MVGLVTGLRTDAGFSGFGQIGDPHRGAESVVDRLDVQGVFTGGIDEIAKAGHHDEALFVSFGETIGDLDLPDRTIEWDWDNELGEEYRTSREFLDVLDLLEGPSVS